LLTCADYAKKAHPGLSQRARELRLFSSGTNRANSRIFEKIAANVGSVKEDPHVEFKILVQEAE
jgi:hypothetical protein